VKYTWNRGREAHQRLTRGVCAWRNCPRGYAPKLFGTVAGMRVEESPQLSLHQYASQEIVACTEGKLIGWVEIRFASFLCARAMTEVWCERRRIVVW
jgi:hypothetical protein